MELAGVFNALGADTHLFVRFDGPLRTFDSILRETLIKEMAASGAYALVPGLVHKRRGRSRIIAPNAPHSAHLYICPRLSLSRPPLHYPTTLPGLTLHPHSTPAGVEKDEGTGRLSLALASGDVHPDFDVVLMVRCCACRRSRASPGGAQRIANCFACPPA